MPRHQDQSLGWIDSLKFLDVKGLRFVREIYDPKLEVRKKGFVMDSVYALRFDPSSPLAQMQSCNLAVEAIVKSNPKVRELQQKARESGYALSLYAAKNPFGMEDLGIDKDTAWLYRLSADQVDMASTVIWVQFNPIQQALWELFPEGEKKEEMLEFDKALLKNLGTDCK